MKRGTLATVLLALTTLGLGCQSKPGISCGGPGGLFGGGCNDCDEGGEGCEVGDACADGRFRPTEPVEAYGANVNYLPNEGRGGPLAALHGRHHRGPQSHMGDEPGPAMGPSSPTYGYPYYTTRGPRDFLNPNPPSIGP